MKISKTPFTALVGLKPILQMLNTDNPRFRILFIFLAFQFFIVGGNSIKGPVIKNYTRNEYQAANQNWSVVQDSHGYMYFANHNGLLEFDGITWTLYPSPNGTIIRTLAVDSKNRIFSAGYLELGFWERNESGRFEYHSLKDKVDANFIANEEFWNIIISNGSVYFQSFSKVYIYDYSTFKIIRPQGYINSISDGGDRIFVNIMDKGIYEISGSSIRPFLLNNQFNHSEIKFILSTNKQQWLIGTSNKGTMLWNGQSLLPWKPDQTEYFKKNIINHGCLTADGKIIIGTILDGISVFDRDGNLLYRLNKGNGLQNNTVLGIFVDSNQNIWLSLDLGIDFITLSSDPSYSILESNEIGAVYTAAIYHDQLYLGTNQGLYHRSLSPGNEPFTLIPSTQGQVWECKVIDDRLFVNHNNGTFEIKGNQTRMISSVSGSFSIILNPLKANSLAQSTYSYLIFYTKQSDDWKISKIIYRFNDLTRFLEIDHLGNFWAGHMYRGIFRLRFDSNDSLVYKRYFGQNVFGKENGIHVFKIENRIVFTTGEKLFAFDDLKDTIVDYDYMNSRLGEYKRATRIVAAPDHYYWFITDQTLGLFKIQNPEVRKIKEFPVGLFNNQLIPGYENIVPISSKKAILCLENGYALLNADTLSPASLISGIRPDLRRIYISDNSEKLTNLPVSEKETMVHYNMNNLQICYAFPFFSSENVKYLSFIEGLDNQWADPIDKPIFNFKRIPVGHYKVRVKAVNNWGVFSQEHSFNLTIMPPWYSSTLAFFCYALLISSGLFAFRGSIIKRTRDKESRLTEEKERELIKLRNENLQAEISFKSSELASSTMAIIKKNEFLMDVKEMMRSQKENHGIRDLDKFYGNLVQKIDDNISSQDDWKVFEANFERAHEQFIRNLKDKYTDLTPSDLRLCAFLRMNLSSKEIAPLMGISVRGVENHRYRLRKKLDLEEDSNLTEFIISL